MKSSLLLWKLLKVNVTAKLWSCTLYFPYFSSLKPNGLVSSHILQADEASQVNLARRADSASRAYLVCECSCTLGTIKKTSFYRD